MRFCLVFSFAVCAFATSPARILESTPIRFEPRSGQWIVKGLNHSIGFTDRATLLHVGERTVSLSFPGSNRAARFAGSNPVVASNYFTGKQYSSVPAFARLRRTAVYPGIDLVYYGNGGELEYDFEIAPAANPGAIRMRFDGADRVALNERGEIVLTLGDGQIVQRTPVVYQKRASGEIVAVESHYRIDKRGDVRVELADYDRTRALVVDPTLNFSAFLYGSAADIGIAIAHDSNGNIYLAGNTWSADFPTSPDAYQAGYLTNQDVWVMKLNPSLGGGAIVYCTFLGGAAKEDLKAMTVDNNGVIYLTGSTDSSGFPVTSGAYKNSIASNTHAFVSVLDPSQAGTAGLIYSTYMGGANFEEGDAIAVANGKIYVAGFTTSDDYPVVAPVQATRVSGYDAFISEFDPAQSGAASLVFSTFLGASGQDLPHTIAVDPAGNIYVAGVTYSNDFPTTPLSYKPFYGHDGTAGDGDGFMTEINPNTSSIVYSTYLGGTFTDDIKKIVIEPNGHVAMTGYTLSPDFPLSPGAYQTTFNTSSCTLYSCPSTAFLTILDLKGGTPLVAGLVYSTLIGGTGGDAALDLKRDSAGRYIICGYTFSTDFPTTPDAFSPFSAGLGPDGFITILDPSQPPFSPKQLVYSTYVTGPGAQAVYGIDVDSAGNIFATGFATSAVFPGGAPYPDGEQGKMSGFIVTLSPQ